MDTKNQEQILKDYCNDELKKLKQICNPIIFRKGVPQMEYDDLYSAALVTLYNSVESFDDSMKCSFQTFLIGNIRRTFYDWTRDRHRYRRCNMKKTEEGEIIVIPDISFDALVEDGVDLNEIIDSGFKIENELSEDIGFTTDDKVDEFLQSLSQIQRQMIQMKMEDIPVSEIKKTLQISNHEYEDNMKAIKENRQISTFYRNAIHKEKLKSGGCTMREKTIIEMEAFIMDLDTTDGYRRDSRTVDCLLKEKIEGELDCNYISQREPFQWNEEQINKYYSRILNNQPIPEIVVCETVENETKVSYLVEGLQRLSYAEEFRENRIAVKDKGAELTQIKYKKYEYDESGNKILDENNRAKFTIDIFDITNKFHRDLPEFLQKRFDNFNITVTTFFNCTSEVIDYHIRNYNNHVGMTKSQYGITSISNSTSKNIKAISQSHAFFLNYVKCTNKSRKKGALEEIVTRSMMTTFFTDSWKKELIEALKFLDKNVSNEQFELFKNNLDRLAVVADKSVQDLFNITNGHIWLSVFHQYTALNIPDIRFIDFMKAFKNSLHSKIIKGRSYDLVNNRNTKDKTTVVNKINVLVDLMVDYLQNDPEKVIQ